MRFSSDFICNTSEYEFGTDVCGNAGEYAAGFCFKDGATIMKEIQN